MSHELLDEWRSTPLQHEMERYVAVAPCLTNCWTSGALRLYNTKENVMWRWRHVARTAGRVALYASTTRNGTLCGGGAMSHELLDEGRSTPLQHERERYVAVAPCRTNCWTSGALRLYNTKWNVMWRWRHVARNAGRVAPYASTTRKRTLCGGGAMSHELLDEWRSTPLQHEMERYVAVAPCRTKCWTSGALRLYNTKENVMWRWRHVARTAARVALYASRKRKITLCGGGAMSHELLNEWRFVSLQTTENNHQTNVILAVVIRN